MPIARLPFTRIKLPGGSMYPFSIVVISPSRTCCPVCVTINWLRISSNVLYVPSANIFNSKFPARFSPVLINEFCDLIVCIKEFRSIPEFANFDMEINTFTTSVCSPYKATFCTPSTETSWVFNFCPHSRKS